MHGSLLPQYRGRAPVNWAVLHGERETGATLHYMTDEARRGDIVAQTAVPILPDDTAREVFDKVTVAAEICLDARAAGARSPAPRRGGRRISRAAAISAAARPRTASSTGRRRARHIHNLVRAVAPPYPGAFTAVAGVPARVLRTRVLDTDTPHAFSGAARAATTVLVAHCGGGGTLRIDALEIGHRHYTPSMIRSRWGDAPLSLT